MLPRWRKVIKHKADVEEWRKLREKSPNKVMSCHVMLCYGKHETFPAFSHLMLSHLTPCKWREPRLPMSAIISSGSPPADRLGVSYPFNEAGL